MLALQTASLIKTHLASSIINITDDNWSENLAHNYYPSLSCFHALCLISLYSPRWHSDLAFNWPFVGFDVSLLSFITFLFDPERLKSSIFFESVRFNWQLWVLLSTKRFLSIFFLFSFSFPAKHPMLLLYLHIVAVPPHFISPFSFHFPAGIF